MADDGTPLKLSQQLVMTPQLQLAIKLLGMPSSELPALVATWRAERPGAVEDLAAGERDPADAVEIEDAAFEGRAAWCLLDDDPFAVPAVLLPVGLFSPPSAVAIDLPSDVWVFGNPPEARANGRAFPRLRGLGGSPDHVRDAAWFIRALRQRARTYERVVGALVACQPRIAVTLDGNDVEPVPIRKLAETIGIHESTVKRVVTACTFRNVHGEFALAAIKRGIVVRRRSD